MAAILLPSERTLQWGIFRRKTIKRATRAERGFVLYAPDHALLSLLAEIEYFFRPSPTGEPVARLALDDQILPPRRDYKGHGIRA